MPPFFSCGGRFTLWGNQRRGPHRRNYNRPAQKGKETTRIEGTKQQNILLFICDTPIWHYLISEQKALFITLIDGTKYSLLTFQNDFAYNGNPPPWRQKGSKPVLTNSYGVHQSVFEPLCRGQSSQGFALPDGNPVFQGFYPARQHPILQGLCPPERPPISMGVPPSRWLPRRPVNY